MDPIRRSLLCAAAAWAVLPAAAQRDLYEYSGPDRMERIAAAAKKEGTLTLYTTIAEKDLPAVVKPFEDKYGIKVTIWRAGTDKVLQRTIQEERAGRHDVDVVHFGSPEMEALAREKILAPVASPVHKDLLEGSVLTETVFAWPGLGQYITSSLLSADMNAVLGGTIVVGTIFIGLNLLSDILYRLVDPRAR